MSEYHINLFWSDEDRCWVADIPDLRYCSAFGSTPREALDEVLKAKEAWLASARVRRDPVPVPRYHPPIPAVP
jgi:predicted RNase H-like HicB family nuclease